jgi:hypothetical protein
MSDSTVGGSSSVAPTTRRTSSAVADVGGVRRAQGRVGGQLHGEAGTFSGHCRIPRSPRSRLEPARGAEPVGVGPGVATAGGGVPPGSPKYESNSRARRTRPLRRPRLSPTSATIAMTSARRAGPNEHQPRHARRAAAGWAARSWPDTCRQVPGRPAPVAARARRQPERARRGPPRARRRTSRAGDRGGQPWFGPPFKSGRTSRSRPSAREVRDFDRPAWDAQRFGGLGLCELEQEARADHFAVLVAQPVDRREECIALLRGQVVVLRGRLDSRSDCVRGTLRQTGPAARGSTPVARLVCDDAQQPRSERRPLAKAGSAAYALRKASWTASSASVSGHTRYAVRRATSGNDARAPRTPRRHHRGRARSLRRLPSDGLHGSTVPRTPAPTCRFPAAGSETYSRNGCIDRRTRQRVGGSFGRRIGRPPADDPFTQRMEWTRPSGHGR